MEGLGDPCFTSWGNCSSHSAHWWPEEVTSGDHVFCSEVNYDITFPANGNDWECSNIFWTISIKSHGYSEY